MAKKRPSKSTQAGSKPPRGAAGGPRRQHGTKVKLYEAIGERASEHILEASRQGRDIGPWPEVADRARRDRAKADLEFFLRETFPGTFRLGWSPDHRQVIGRLQEVVEHGGRYCLAMPRGHGKSSLIERAALWGALSGRRRFIVIICANEGLAELSLGRLRSELENNDRLLEDWPRAAHAIRRLEGQSKRCLGQHVDGVRTRITLKAKRLILPYAVPPDNESSEAVICACGLGAAVRGLNYTTAAGDTLRPDLVLVDDPQDDDSARSVIQTSQRLATLNGTLMGLGGPDQRVAALAALTIIQRHDLSDQLLDPVKNPTWRGEKYQLVYEWPTRADLWETYSTLRAEGFLPNGDRGEAAQAFYLENRREMDEGARVSWEARFEPGEVSAIQHAYHLKADLGEETFMAEMMNDPPDRSKDVDALDPVAVASRLGGFDRYEAPPEAERLTGFVDVGSGLLWYAVCGWATDFSCSVLDWGAFPGQRPRVFASRNASPTLQDLYGHVGGSEAAIYSGLAALIEQLFGREWRRSDGASLPLGRVLIDSGYASEVVRRFIRASKHRDFLTPSKGMGLGPGQTAIADFRQRPGEKLGDGYVLGQVGPDKLRLCRFDSNLAKDRAAAMLRRPLGLGGGVTLWGTRAVDHELFALHCSAEYPVATTARGNTVNVWQRRVDQENHLYDCLVGNIIAATMEGLSPLGALGHARPKEPRKSGWAEFRARMNGGPRP